MMGIDRDCVEMVGIHVVETGLLAGGQLLDDRPIGEGIGTVEQIGLAETAIEAGSLWLEAEDREIAEPGIELCLGIAVEIAPLGAGMRARPAFKWLRPADQRYP